MRKLLCTIVAFAALAAAPGSARADGFLSFDALYIDGRGYVFFDGDVRDANGYPVGGDVEIQLDLAGNVELQATTGFLYGIAGDATNFHIPFMGGLVYNFKQGASTPFLGGTFGAMISYASIADQSDTNINGTFEVSGGYQTSSIRFKLGIHFFDIGEIADSASAFASIGFNLK